MIHSTGTTKKVNRCNMEIAYSVLPRNNHPSIRAPMGVSENVCTFFRSSYLWFPSLYRIFLWQEESCGLSYLLLVGDISPLFFPSHVDEAISAWAWVYCCLFSPHSISLHTKENLFEPPPSFFPGNKQVAGKLPQITLRVISLFMAVANGLNVAK